ncbi:GPR1/FUN34/yaaH family-domain-containing protein [Chlamydoabsidia padenii]|nr:GPR1/FUN34/yaaH family-domain-containing protein [Chlamydoabsidia padenii]
MSNQPSTSTSSHYLLPMMDLKNRASDDFYLNRPHFCHHLYQHQHEEEGDEEKSHGMNTPMLFRPMNPPPPSGSFGILAIWSFATVTTLLATYNLFLPTTSNHIIFPTALLFGGFAQVISGFFVLANGNTFGGILFVSFGTFWTGDGLMMIPSLGITNGLTSEEIQVGNGIYHFVWGFYCLIFVVLSLRIRGGHAMMTWNLVCVFLTLLLTGVSFMVKNNVVLIRLSGVTAYLAAFGAWYTGIAELLEGQHEGLWLGYYHHHHHYK